MTRMTDGVLDRRVLAALAGVAPIGMTEAELMYVLNVEIDVLRQSFDRLLATAQIDMSDETDLEGAERTRAYVRSDYFPLRRIEVDPDDGFAITPFPIG